MLKEKFNGFLKICSGHANEEKKNQMIYSSSSSFASGKKLRMAGVLTGLILLLSSFVYWLFNKQMSTTEKFEKSIAVLPFKNLSSNPEDRYLADGMMDAILSHLQKIKDLRVRSRSSTDQYRESVPTARQVGEELNVTYILEGSFQKVGNKANLIVQLIQTRNDEHLWAEEYNRDWSDIFDVQKDVADLIAHELYASISKEEGQAIDVIPTFNMIAYDYYLKGNEAHWNFWKDRDRRKIQESLELFQKAIDLDENFSLAYAGLGRAYSMLAETVPKSAADSYTKSKINLEKAISLDPYNGWAYAELGTVNIDWEWDSTAARKNFDLARKMIPNNLDAYRYDYGYSLKVGNCRRLEAIRDEMKKIDPDIQRDSLNHINLTVLTCKGQYQKVCELADHYWQQHATVRNSRPIFTSLMRTGQYEKCRKILQYYATHSEDKAATYQLRGILEAKTGEEDVALEMIDSLKMLSETTGAFNSRIASIYAALGNKEAMYFYLDEALKNRERDLHFLKHYGSLDPYFHEPRFREILSKMWVPLKAKHD